MARETSHQKTRSITDMKRFPPTVVDHTEYPDGVDLHLLDPGTQEEPRFIRIYDDDRETEAYL